MYRFQINRGVRLAVLVRQAHYLILPGDNVLCLYIADFAPLEIGKYLCADNMLFGVPGVLFKPLFDVLAVHFNKTAERHIEVRCKSVQLLALPSLRVTLCGKSALLGLLALTRPIGVTVDRSPGVVVLVNRHLVLPFRRR